MTDTPEQPPKKAGLLASTAVVATMTMLWRVLGLVRDVVIARTQGASCALYTSPSPGDRQKSGFTSVA